MLSKLDAWEAVIRVRACMRVYVCASVHVSVCLCLCLAPLQGTVSGTDSTITAAVEHLGIILGKQNLND